MKESSIRKEAMELAANSSFTQDDWVSAIKNAPIPPSDYISVVKEVAPYGLSPDSINQVINAYTQIVEEKDA